MLSIEADTSDSNIEANESVIHIKPDSNIRVYLYQLNEEEAAMEEVDDERAGEESLPAYQHLILPSRSVAGVWER